MEWSGNFRERMEMKQLLEKLSNAPGVSGHENVVRDLILEEIKPYIDDYEIDNMGNLITTKRGTGGPKIMLAAHMDEIGLIVKYIDEHGFIYFSPVGGWFDQTLLNQRMIIHTDNKKEYYGVIGSKPPHVMKSGDYDKVIKSDDMFIDVGATCKYEVEQMGIEIGNQIVPDAKFCTLHKDRIAAKAFDNRAGCVMLIETMKRIKNNVTVHAVFTVQEEVGLKGAKTAAFKLNPNFSCATDVTIAGDHPNISQKESNISLGKGPVVTLSDGGGRGIIVPKLIIDKIKNVVNEYNIPVQYEVSNGGTTDGMAIQLTREGILTGVIAIPTRYIHTPYSVVDIQDIENAIRLLTHMLESW